MPDIAILRISVQDADGSLGWACLPMDSIRPGFRVVPLRFAKTPLAYVIIHTELKISNGRFSDFADMLANPTAYTSKSAKNLAAISDLLVPDDEEGALNDLGSALSGNGGHQG